MRILVAENKNEIANALAKRKEYTVETASGTEVPEYAACEEYDVIIIDVESAFYGKDILSKLREDGIGTPVMVIMSGGDVRRRISSLDSGADDCLVRPFIAAELEARLRALVRRRREFIPNELRAPGIILKSELFELSGKNGSEYLSNKEFQVMELLMNNRGRCLSTERLMELVWGYESEAEINVVWVCISGLRRKLSELGSGVRIKSLRGRGYMLEEA